MRFLPVLCAFVSVQASFYDYKYGDGYVSDGEKPTAWQGTLLSGRMSQPKCIDIPKNLTLCQNIGYDQMRLPNLLDHDSINEVIQQSRSWISLLGVHCHPDTKLFLCSLFSPVCLERDREIYPCRSLCESVRDGCETIMKTYSYKWPDMVRCDKFPDDTEMCIPGQSTAMPPTQNLCSACNQINTFESLIHNYCRSTVVIKVKLKKASMRKGNLVVYIKKKKKMIKGNLSKKEKRKLTPIIEDGASCDCAYLSSNSTSKKSFIIMGNMTDEGELSLIFMSTWERNKGFRRAVRMMKKGLSCDSDIIAISDGSKTDNSSGGGKKKGKDKKKGKGRKRKNKGRKNKKKKNRGKKKKNKKVKTTIMWQILDLSLCLEMMTVFQLNLHPPESGVPVHDRIHTTHSSNFGRFRTRSLKGGHRNHPMLTDCLTTGTKCSEKLSAYLFA